ncbi:PiggyBac transposable element-derived protein 2, partial [Armadillidium vulgare]
MDIKCEAEFKEGNCSEFIDVKSEIEIKFEPLDVKDENTANDEHFDNICELDQNQMSTLRRKPIQDDVTLDSLLCEIPSDFEEETDQESDTEDESCSKDPLSKALGEESVEEYDPIQQHKKSRCIIIVNRSDQQNTSTGQQNQINEIEDETFRKVKRKWKKKEEASKVRDFSIHQGHIESHFTNCKTATDFFLKFFDAALMEHICFQSNLYATQKYFNLNVCLDEMYVFIGLNIYMGYVVMPSYKNYWSTSVDMKNHFVSSHMTRDRFSNILGYLH